MRRRSFLEILALGAALLALRPAWLPRRRTIHFHVAGVRFHPVGGRLNEGDRIEVRAERFGGTPCYGLYSPAGERLGFIPGELAPALQGRTLKSARLTELRPFAVPWRRLGVTLELS